MQRIPFAIVLLVLSPLVLAGTYKWVDKDGKVHYSDKPPPQGAEEVDLPEPMVFDAPEAAPRPPSGSEEPKGTAGYETFEFISPKQEQVFWATGGEIPVQLALKPGLQNGHRLQVYLDGELAQQPLNGLGLTLTDVFRGAHTVRAAVVDYAGKEVAATETVTFHVKQRSVANPQKAKPRPGK